MPASNRARSKALNKRMIARCRKPGEPPPSKARIRARYRRSFAKRGYGSRGAYTKKSDFIKALKGTGGVLTRIAENLEISRLTVRALLRRPDWADICELVEDEENSIVDEARIAVRDSLRQTIDLRLRGKMSTWVLSRRTKDFADKTRTIIEGGENPIKTINANVNAGVSIDALLPYLSTEQLRPLLAAAEQFEQSQKREAERRDRDVA